MKLIIELPTAIYKYHKKYYNKHNLSCIENAAINGTPLPDNATNGDVIKALFPKTPHGVKLDSYQTEMIFTTTEDWWNAPYTKEKTNDRN